MEGSLIAAYVSGHGFGHATRVGEALRAFRERAPWVPIAIVTSGPESLYRQAIPGPLEVRALACDVGLAQRDALTIDEAETADRCRAFAADWDARVGSEAEWLRRSGVRAVLGDIPPLAFAAAARAGVASVALANFSWDWIYRHLALRQAALEPAAEAAAAAYGLAGLLLELPFAGDLRAFPRREKIPLVARRPAVEREEARRRLGLDGRPAILLSFGGLGLPGFSPSVLAGLAELRFLSSDAVAGAPANVQGVPAALLAERGLAYVDLVGAADVVVTKPGYGIVTDAIGARTRLVYTERGDFPEYPILVREMAAYLPCVHVSNPDLLGGRIGEPIRRVLELPMPPAPDLTGAARVAERLLEVAR